MLVFVYVCAFVCLCVHARTCVHAHVCRRVKFGHVLCECERETNNIILPSGPFQYHRTKS